MVTGMVIVQDYTTTLEH